MKNVTYDNSVNFDKMIKKNLDIAGKKTLISGHEDFVAKGRNESVYSGQPSILQDVLSIDRRWTLEVGLSHPTEIKKCLNMRNIAARWVPHKSTEVQK
ncbi:hypothetical protein TNCV_3614391 [Trichonephila clavipes]|uniref:Uncharacterized protein n=1 Tax=Trichonephila clavipes TaxID=2585209 RepID=A0A8X6SMW6_TRICX|nr:hypothetical protein TNCV_3614391 [Trichonephila clavipes]